MTLDAVLRALWDQVLIIHMSKATKINANAPHVKPLRTPDDVQEGYERVYDLLMFLAADPNAEPCDRVRALAEARKVLESVERKPEQPVEDAERASGKLHQFFELAKEGGAA